MMSPKVSIIIPVFNVQDYLEKCLDSILNQVFQDFEIILINDGSTDESGEICNRYANLDQRIRVIHKKNEGVSSARNYGINHSLGQFITFIDGDDYIEDDFLKVLYDLIMSYNCDMVMCSYKFIYEDKIIDNGSLEWNFYNKEEACRLFFNDLSPFAPSYTCGRIVKKSLFDNLRFREDIFLMEDTLLNTELLLKCRNGIIVSNQTLYNYLQRAGSASKSYSRRRVTSFYALEELLRLSKMISPEYEKSFLKVYNKLNFAILQDIIRYDFKNSEDMYIEISKGISKKFWSSILLKEIPFKHKVHLITLKINPYFYKWLIGLF